MGFEIGYKTEGGSNSWLATQRRVVQRVVRLLLAVALGVCVPSPTLKTARNQRSNREMPPRMPKAPRRQVTTPRNAYLRRHRGVWLRTSTSEALRTLHGWSELRALQGRSWFNALSKSLQCLMEAQYKGQSLAIVDDATGEGDVFRFVF
jgi:hypothetical protein